LVAIADGIDRIAWSASELERACGELGVDRQRRARDRTGAEWTVGELVGHRAQQSEIASERLAQRTAEPGAREHADRDLAMGVARHRDLAKAHARAIERHEHAVEVRLEQGERIATPQLQI